MKEQNKINKLITGFFALMSTFVPVATHAVHGTNDMGVGYVASVSNPNLWVATIIGTTVAICSIYFSVQMSGSTIGSAMKFFGIGMLLITSGFMSVVFQWPSSVVRVYLHDGGFIIGCLFCLWGIFRIRKLSQ